ncbi:response regulator [Variovorax ginsengisoli]|uniref:Two-component system response regulator QseB/two-component system response regulator BasR n=1 Tax=Variovorax ginsengisoli TaxID=363844 RepID=A0ABT9S1Y1_9BURK|nr:response regulator transcription factor [Variovorax ginsengisoli]MDP9898365.1 two-component system response regulator QseB/two-component system response regulator BasR [Variovorax ginsengisoli]
MHLLLIEDDMDLGRALQSALKVEALSSEWLRRAADAPVRLDAEAFDCVLLDLGLPDASGFDLLARWRGQGCLTPIIVVTARGAVEDRLAGLNGGADDFVVKPFETLELIARIHAVARRAARQASERWVIGDLVIEPRRHGVRRDGQPVALSPREFQILLELARDPGAVIPKHLLAQRMTPLGNALDASALEVHVSNLRRKIGADCIRTVRGVGYLLVAP